MADDVEARIEVVIEDKGGSTPPSVPSSATSQPAVPTSGLVQVPDYWRRPASAAPSVGIIPVQGARGTLPERNIRGQFISRSEAAATGYATPEGQTPRDSRGRFLPRPRPVPAASPAPSTPIPEASPSGRIEPQVDEPSPFGAKQSPIPEDQLAKLTPQQRLELQETWGVDLGKYAIAPATIKSEAEQRRIRRMQVASLKQEKRLAQADQRAKKRRQAEADKEADRHRAGLDRQQRDENREAIGRTKSRNRIRARIAKRSAAARSPARILRMAQTGMMAGRAAMHGSLAGAGAAVGAGPVGIAIAGVVAAAAAFHTAKTAILSFADEGLVPTVKQFSRLIPVVSTVAETFDALNKRFERDKAIYRPYSASLMSAEAVGDANLTLGRINRLYRRDNIAGGRSLDELLGERQRANSRFQNANEDIEAAISKALYAWSNPWLRRFTQVMEMVAELSNTWGPGLEVGLDLLPEILVRVIMQAFPGGGILAEALLLLVDRIAKELDRMEVDRQKKDAEVMKLFAEKYQSNLMSIFNDPMEGLNQQERDLMKNWMKGGGGQKRPPPLGK